MIRAGGSHVQRASRILALEHRPGKKKGAMALPVDRLKNLSSVLAILALVACGTGGCGDSEPVVEPDSSFQRDAGIDRADVGAIDSSSADRSLEDGASEDAASNDAGSEDTSSQDRLSEDRRTEGDASSDRDGMAGPSDADAATDDDGGVDAVDARDGDVTVDGVDADIAVDTDPDGGCACTPDDQMGVQSLACYCANGCLSYDDAIVRCPPTSFPDGHRIDTYADCNLVVITIVNSIGIGGSTNVYDATTHEFVGGSSGADYPAFLCGTTPVFGFRAGTFPLPNCPRTQSVPRCVDGGDGGDGG